MSADSVVLNEPMPERELHQLQCLEIWGGNRQVEDSVSVHGIDAWVLSIPSAGAEAGGDIHYVSMCGAGKIARFAVADVAGHGPSADQLASALRALMRKHIGHVNQAAFAKSLNREFGRLAGEGRFATALLTSYFAPTDQLVLCNAGHPAPLWYRADQNTWQELKPDCRECIGRLWNFPLGIVDSTDYVQFAVQLTPDDLVVICTDSLSEAMDPGGNMLGGPGLLQLLQRLDPRRPDLIGRGLLKAVEAYRGGQPLEDDVTVMVLSHNGSNPPPMSLFHMIKVAGKMLGIIPS